MANQYFNSNFELAAPLAGLFGGIQQAQEEDRSALANAFQQLQNERYGQMTPLEVQLKQYELPLGQLKAERANIELSPENLDRYGQQIGFKFGEAQRADELAQLQHPTAKLNVDMNYQLAQIDHALTNKKWPDGQRLSPESLAILQQERNSLVQRMALSPETLSKVEINAARPKPVQTIDIVDPNNPNRVITVDRTTREVLGTAPKESKATQEESGLTTAEINKRNAAYPKASGSYNSFLNQSKELERLLESLKTNPGLSGITGLVYGRTPAITDAARDAMEIYNQIMAKGGFSTLQDMRANSPTGGALGNVSDTENKYLRSAFGALGREQSTESMRKHIDDALQQLRNSRQIISNTFEDTYSYRKDLNKPSTENQPESVTVGGQTYQRPANFTDKQWNDYKKSVGVQ